MALTVIKLFAPLQLGTGETTIYQCAAAPSTTVLKNGRLRLSNITAGAVTVTLHNVPSGGSAGDANAFMKGESIAANSHVDVDMPTLAAGDTVSGLAGAATSINVQELGGVLYS